MRRVRDTRYPVTHSDLLALYRDQNRSRAAKSENANAQKNRFESKFEMAIREATSSVALEALQKLEDPRDPDMPGSPRQAICPPRLAKRLTGTLNHVRAIEAKEAKKNGAARQHLQPIAAH
jgi:hypothetical protein